MTKNPFEVRLDVLKMAQEMLETEQRTKELKFREQVETMRSSANALPGEILNYIDTNSPAPYTPEDVIARSAALYSFISDKK